MVELASKIKIINENIYLTNIHPLKNSFSTATPSDQPQCHAWPASFPR